MLTSTGFVSTMRGSSYVQSHAVLLHSLYGKRSASTVGITLGAEGQRLHVTKTLLYPLRCAVATQDASHAKVYVVTGKGDADSLH